MKMRWLILTLALALSNGCALRSHPTATVSTPVEVTEAPVALPNAEGSFKFAVIGDWGTGGRDQYAVAAQMAKLHETFKFDTVITVGDNLYGSQKPKDYEKKFEIPYKPLLDAGVKFYATLGNHDSREQTKYELFNMGGEFYYSFRPPDQSVRFFMLDSNYPSPEQLEWLTKELKSSDSKWKFAAFHHPLYSSGRFHGSDLKLREIWEELFVQNNVSVVFAGHDHFYERVKPQRGIVHFVVGSCGKLRAGNINKRSGLTAKGFDRGFAFLVAEIVDDTMYFNTIGSEGTLIDSGIIQPRVPIAQIGMPK
jgi:hypothetical protein